MGLFSSKKKYATVSTKDIIKPKKVVNNNARVTRSLIYEDIFFNDLFKEISS